MDRRPTGDVAISTADGHLVFAGTSRDTVRVLALGDCNTNTVDPLQGTAADGLVEALQAQGHCTTLVNLSGGMASSREGLAQILDYNCPADLTIVNYGLVDAWVTTIPHFYVPYYPDNRMRRRLRKLLKFVKRRLRPGILQNLVPTGPVVPADEFLENIKAIIRTVILRNPSTAVFLWGTVPVDDSERNLGIVKYNGILKQAAATASATYVDTAKVLTSLPAREWFIDGVHLSPDAARRIGEHIAALYLNSSMQSIESQQTAA